MARPVRLRCGLFLAALAVAFWAGAPSLRAAETLDIYFIDCGGSVGNATLLVSPSGESMMLDSGPPYVAKRVLHVFKQLGLSKLDYMLSTHYHADHFGAAAAVSEGLKVVTFVDHGESVETGKTDDWWKQRRAPWFRVGMGKQYDDMYERYAKAREAGKHLVVGPGDVVPINGFEARVVCSGAKVLAKPLPGAGGPNPASGKDERRADDDCEDAQSIGVLATFGSFRFAYLGDLTWNVAIDLFSPENKVGPVDAYVVTHHAQSFPLSMGAYYQGLSACPKAELAGLRPRVAILSLGLHGHRQGDSLAMETVRSSLGLEDVWQTHFVVDGGEKDHNSPKDFCASVEGDDPQQVRYIKLSADRDGSFTVSNSRNGFSKRYAARIR
jgi:hypothetical protein